MGALGRVKRNKEKFLSRGVNIIILVALLLLASLVEDLPLEGEFLNLGKEDSDEESKMRSRGSSDRTLFLSARETTYYFSTTGNDLNSGLSPAAPKQTLQEAQRIVTTVLKPGEAVLFKRGDTWNSTQPFPISRVSGTARLPITIGAYGNGPRPVLSFSGIPNPSAIFYVHDSNNRIQYLIFDGLQVTSSDPHTLAPQGWNIRDTADHITFRNMLISDLGFGINNRADHLTIEDSVLLRNYNDQGYGDSHGIFSVQAANLVVKNTYFKENGNDGDTRDHHIYLSGGSSNILVENNEFNMTLERNALKLRGVTDAVVRGNVMYDSIETGITLGGDANYELRNVTIDGNVFTHNRIAIDIKVQTPGTDLGAHEVVVGNNLFLGPRHELAGMSGGQYGGFVRMNGYMGNISFIHNLFYNGTETHDISILAEPEYLMLANNIFYKTDTTTLSPFVPGSRVIFSAPFLTDFSFDYNLYDFLGTLFELGGIPLVDLSALRAVLPTQEQNGIEGDPLLVNAPGNYTPSAMSPAVDTGQYFAQVKYDFYRTIRPQGVQVDRGPIEIKA